MPAFILGPIAGFVLKHPKVAAFIKRFWKVGLGIALAIAAYFAFTNWLAGERKESFNSGFAAAEQQYATAVEAANQRAAEDQKALDLMRQRFELLALNREQDVKLIVQPQIERITREVQDNPVYRQCTVTDGVWNDLNAAGSAVNARIAPSKP